MRGQQLVFKTESFENKSDVVVPGGKPRHETKRGIRKLAQSNLEKKAEGEEQIVNFSENSVLNCTRVY